MKTKRGTLEWAANTYILSRKALKVIDKKDIDRYNRCLELIKLCELILSKNGVKITV